MDTRCTSCGEDWPLWTMPDFDPGRDLFGVCAPCIEMSQERARREAFAREATSPWVQRALAGALPTKDLTNRF